jgi:hypothetical protein
MLPFGDFQAYMTTTDSQDQTRPSLGSHQPKLAPYPISCMDLVVPYLEAPPKSNAYLFHL